MKLGRYVHQPATVEFWVDERVEFNSFNCTSVRGFIEAQEFSFERPESNEQVNTLNPLVLYLWTQYRRLEEVYFLRPTPVYSDGPVCLSFWPRELFFA